MGNMINQGSLTRANANANEKSYRFLLSFFFYILRFFFFTLYLQCRMNRGKSQPLPNSGELRTFGPFAAPASFSAS